MVTGVFEIELKDNRKYRIHFANQNQQQRVLRSYESIKHLSKGIKTLTCGLHDVKQWTNIVSQLKTQ